MLRRSGVWLLVTKKLPFIISEFEMVQATFWNTNNGGYPSHRNSFFPFLPLFFLPFFVSLLDPPPPRPPSARQALLFEESVSKLIVYFASSRQARLSQSLSDCRNFHQVKIKIVVAFSRQNN